MKLSICMMVKNEAENLPRCLDSLQLLCKQVQSELIIVDTGSEDETVEIARRYTDKVFYHPWNDNFSAMRNITISYATGEWVMIIDADEELERGDILATYLQSEEAKQYVVVAIGVKNFVSLDPEEYSSMISFRIFKRNKHFYYDGAVHNQPFFKGEQVALPAVSLRHYGYLANDENLMERKFARTCGILKRELEKDPGNIYYWTQLSVTYAMHNDYKEAIAAAEKGYSLLPKKKNANCMYVLIQLMAVYQREGLHTKIITVAEEALEIKEGYLDVYYYYAEALAITRRYADAISFYDKYFKIAENYEGREERDVSIVEYTLAYKQVAYYNMSQICKEEGLYERAIEYAEKITDRKYKMDNMLNLVELYLYKEFYDKLAMFDVGLSSEERNQYYAILSEKMATREADVKQRIAETFSLTPNIFGLMCKMIVEAQRGSISKETRQRAETLKLNELPVYCSGIVYFLMKYNGNVRNLFSEYKENWINTIFERIACEYNDLSIVLQSYSQELQINASFAELKLGKILCRYALLLNQLNSEEHMTIFERYLKFGAAYMDAVYSPAVQENDRVYELKNDEEVFFLYMAKAQRLESVNQAEAIGCLRLAVQAFPSMKSGVERLLQTINNNQSKSNAEMEIYKTHIKALIRKQVAESDLYGAQKLLDEYNSIVKNDLEAVLLQSEIMVGDCHG